MKFRHTKIKSSQSGKRSKKGFALIATLTLMMLLAMLAVGLMAMATSQNRIALQVMLQSEARQQALVGLDAAIGALQAELGPDQRVTASSGILSENDKSTQPQHILGVWNSWDGPIYGESVSNKGAKIASTYVKGRAPMFRRWLVSSKDTDMVRKMESVAKLCSRKPGSRVCMVGEGTLGRSFTAQHYVYADLLSMPTLGKNEACFAWWVGGENQKAKVSVQDPEESQNPIEVLSRTWDTPGPMFVDNKELDFLPERVEEPARVVTLSSLPLLGSSSQSAGMPYFFDVTTTSYSLPINVSMGGFKQDLCLLLNKPSLKGTDFEVRADQDCPLAENSAIPAGVEPNMPIGSWQNLHAYYNCWPDGNSNDSGNFSARLIGNLENAFTRISGSVFNSDMEYGEPGTLQGGSGGKTFFDTRSLMESGSNTSGYARTPVMLAYLANFGLVVEESKGPDGSTVKLASTQNPSGEELLYNLSICFSPMFLWWNPYNVPMKIRGRQMWSRGLPSKTAWIQTYTFSQKSAVKDWNDRMWWYRGIYRTNQNDKEVRETLGKDYGEFFQVSEDNQEGDIVFEPGEILFFSPAKPRDKNSQKMHSNPWVLGYNASSVAGYKATVYYHENNGYGQVKSESLGAATETNINAGRFYLDMRLGVNTPVPPGHNAAGVDNPENENPADGKGYVGPDGFRYGARSLDAITVLNGFNGMETIARDAASVNDDDKAQGKRGQSPQLGLLGWYNPDDKDVSTVFCDHNRDGAVWSLDGTQSDSSVPFFVASLGIVAKSANRNLDSKIYPDRDFRTKTWQHSSPAFWGGMLVRPDDQQRQYHPYQLATLNVSGGMTSCPMDNLGKNGMLGINSDGEQVSFASVLELPVHPPFSLAGFAGMRLQPGWYKSSNSRDQAAQTAMRRMLYQAGVPGVGIGNSFADPCLPAEDIYTLYESQAENSDLGVFGSFYDHGLLINDALWDRWFCSSVSDIPVNKGKKQAKDVLTSFLSGKEQLPVSRYKRVSTPYNDEALVERIMSTDGWKYIAQYLMIDGGFNVNSISVEAWAAVLQGLAKRKLVTGKGGHLAFVEDGKKDKQVLFSRFMLSTTDKSIDGLGGYSAMQGSPDFRNSGMTSAWGEVRMLEPEGIRMLAEKMVQQVRKRGPFLSMSDFINRRLERGENGLKGALQAAIDATDINMDFDTPVETKITQVPTGSLYKNEEAAKGSMHTAAPGYLIQSDVLASLGNILTVRDDTFTVRAYGCVRNPNKAVLAQAWCEAVVQRTVQYVDPDNKPEDSDYTPEGKKNGKALSNVNKVLGRQFRIVSFKWLDSWDI